MLPLERDPERDLDRDMESSSRIGSMGLDFLEFFLSLTGDGDQVSECRRDIPQVRFRQNFLKILKINRKF